MMVEASNFKHPVVDLDEFERRLRGPESSANLQGDPLAELERLVNGDTKQLGADPVADLFARAPKTLTPAPSTRDAGPMESTVVRLPKVGWERAEPAASSAASIESQMSRLHEGLRSTMPAEDPQVTFERELREMHVPLDDIAPRPAAPVTVRASVIQPRVEPQIAPLPRTEPAFAQHQSSPAQPQHSPEGEYAHTDVLASEIQGNLTEDHGSGQSDWDAYAQDAIVPPARVRRGPVFIMGGIALAGLAIIGGSFAMKGGSASAQRNIPVVKAQDGPVKVASNVADGQVVPNQNASILDKATGNVKGEVNAIASVAAKEEQPIDISAAPKAPANTQPAQPLVKAVAPPSLDGPADAGFAAPKKVKSVAVRPDGTVITNAPAPVAAPVAVAIAPVARPLPANPLVAANPLVTASSTAPNTPPAKPKATVRVVNVPKTDPKPVGTTAAADTAPGADAAAPLQLNSSGKRLGPPRVKVADAAPTAPAARTQGSGGFAVQLAAPSDQQEAKDVSARLQRQFASELEGRTPSIRSGENSGRTVYRVRVGGLSRDEANALCAKLKAGGGSCFVAGN